MGLKAILDSLDGVPDELHALYVEKDGKFILDLEGFDAHPLAKGWQDKLKLKERLVQENLAKVKTLEERLSVLPEEFDPAEYEKLKADAAAREEDPEGKDVRKQIETAVTAARQHEQTKFNNEIKKRDAKIAELEDSNKGYVSRHRESLIDKALEDAADAAQVKPGLRRAFKAVLRPDIDESIEDGDDGRPVVRVKSGLGGDQVEAYGKTFTQTEEGKHFVEPAKGSDAPGGDNKRAGTRRPAGNMGGTKEERMAAIASRFPELTKKAG